MNPGSIIIRDVKITGTLEFSGNLFLDCHFKGDIRSDGELTIGENAVFEGELHTRKLILNGKLTGNVVAEETCRLKRTAEMTGDIKAASLLVDEGASFSGFTAVPFKKSTELSLPHFTEPTPVSEPPEVAEIPDAAIVNFPSTKPSDLPLAQVVSRSQATRRKHILTKNA
jgi:cytoskeletal protein CcmA (bactofilin family)